MPAIAKFDNFVMLVNNSIKIQVVQNDITNEEVGAVIKVSNCQMINSNGKVAEIVREGGAIVID